MTIKYIFCLLLILSSLNVNSQDTIKEVLKDAIQIHGIVRYPDSTPATNLFIRSKTYPNNIKTFTDNLGQFTLKNALFQDTLLIGAAYKPNFPYKGSRFIDIIIPQLSLELPSLEKTEKRINPKKDVNIELIEIKPTHNIFYSIEAFAEYPGGIEAFCKDLKEKVCYPQKAIEENIEGEVSLSFIINKEGFLSDIKILRGIGYGCEEEVVKRLRALKRWKPTVVYGKPLEQHFKISYTFTLKD